MSAYDIAITAHGWQVAIGSIVLEASGIVRDRDRIRCVLTARRDGNLIDRIDTNLTGERARGRFVSKLREKQIDIPESALLALDEAIRYSPRPSPNGHHYDAPSDISETVSLAELTERVKQWLLLEDEDVLPVVLGAVAAHRLGGESPWLLLVAPPSGTKTEILRMTWKTPGIFPLSDLTARTFASGLDVQGSDPSLLSRLKDEILCLKDFTTVLEMYREERQAVLAQLREIYDGRFDKAWGTGKELHWTGRLGFLAGVTPVIDQHHAVMGILGPRFLIFRVVQPDRQQVAIRAMENAAKEVQMRTELAKGTADFFAGVSTKPPKVDTNARVWLAQVADIVTRARSPVLRDGYRRELEYAPEPESPSRLARQLHALLEGVAAVHARTVATAEDALRVRRVAWDCIPAIRRFLLQALVEADTALKTATLAGGVRYATPTVRRALEDLQALGLVECIKGANADEWFVSDLWRAELEALIDPKRAGVGGVSDMSEGVSQTELTANPDPAAGSRPRPAIDPAVLDGLAAITRGEQCPASIPMPLVDLLIDHDGLTIEQVYGLKPPEAWARTAAIVNERMTS